MSLAPCAAGRTPNAAMKPTTIPRPMNAKRFMFFLPSLDRRPAALPDWRHDRSDAIQNRARHLGPFAALHRPVRPPEPDRPAAPLFAPGPPGQDRTQP